MSASRFDFIFAIRERVVDSSVRVEAGDFSASRIPQFANSVSGIFREA